MRQAGISRASAKRLAAALAAGSTFTKPSAGPSRRTRIKPVSTKRAKENRQRAKVIDELWPGRIVECWRDGCTRLADDVHEIQTRARGGSITDPANLAPLCRTCHGEATREAPWAYEQGLLAHSWPAAGDGAEVAA
jgi:5-methylcytosine-specific restriction endonuclease McrA